MPCVHIKRLCVHVRTGEKGILVANALSHTSDFIHCLFAKVVIGCSTVKN